jgi:hypothetical protein
LEEERMRVKGIGYDTGFSLDGVTHRPFDHHVVRRELEIIRDDLHCTAVRPFGNNLDRLDFAASYAAELGLDVWYSPFTYNLDSDAMLDLLVDAAQRAERIRQRYDVEVVLVAGAELSIFNSGFLPGEDIERRVANLLARTPQVRALMAGIPDRVNEFFGRAVPLVRQRFGGKVTYAAIPYEGVDWELFDIVSLDAHRTKEIADTYPASIRQLVAQGKPVAITEVGCTAYKSASDNAAQSGAIVEYEHGRPVRLTGAYVRDEGEQASYLTEMLGILDDAGVDAAFVCTFVCYGLPHRADPRTDLDMASWGIVKELEAGSGDTYPDLPWEPKVAFGALADIYG